MPAMLHATPARALDLGADATLLDAIGQVATACAGADGLLTTIATGDAGGVAGAALSGAGLAAILPVLRAGLPRLLDATRSLSRYAALWNTVISEQGQSPPAPPRITWTASTAAPPVAGAKPLPFGIDLHASAMLALNAAATWPQSGGANCLSIAADGKVIGDASATTALPYGSLSASGQASADLKLTWYEDADGAELLAVALARCLPGLADPFDFAEVWTAITESGLRALTYEFDGAATVTLQVALADSARLARGLIPADLGASISVSLSPSAAYTLTVERVTTGAGNAMRATLERARLLTSDVAGRLGVDVDLSALTAPIARALTAMTDNWDKVLTGIKPFLYPGSTLAAAADAWLTSQIGALVADPGLRAALIADLKGAGGADQITEAGLSAWLTGQVAGAIDRAGVLLQPAASAALTPVLSAIGGVAPGFKQAASAGLTALVDDALTHIGAEFEQAVGALVRTEAGPLAAALGRLGVAVAGPLDTLDAALVPVRGLLRRMDALLHTLLGKAEAALKQKATAQFSFEDQTGSGTSVAVKGVFGARNDDAAGVFGALVTGRLDTLVSLVDGSFVAPGFTLDPASAVTQYSKGRSDSGINVVFLGLDVGASDSNVYDADVITDALGNVHVGSEDALSKTFLGRVVRFTDTQALTYAAATAAARAGGGASVPVPSLDLGVGATLTLTTKNWAPLDGFFATLSRLRLIGPGASAAAHTAFGAWSAAAPGPLEVSLAVSLPVAGDAIDRLLFLPGGSGLTDAQNATVLGEGFDAWMTTNPTLRPRLMAALADIENGLGLPEGTPVGDVLLAYWKDQAATPPGIDPAHYDSISEVADLLATLLALPGIFAEMRAIYQARPAGVAGGAGWTADEYSRAQGRLGAACDQWLTVFENVVDSIGGPLLSDFGTALTDRTQAFLMVLRDRAGLGPAGGLKVTMSCAGAQTRAVAVG